MRLGLTSVDYDNPWDCLSDMARLDLSCLEVYIDADFTERNAHEITAAAAAEGVTVTSFSSLAKLSQAEEDLDEHRALIEQCIQYASACSVGYVTFMAGGSASLDRHSALERFLSRVEPLSRLAVDSGVALLVENVFSRYPSGDLDSVAWTRHVLEQLSEYDVLLNLDFGNFAIAGDEAYPYAWSQLGPYAKSVHLKDVCRYDAGLHGPLGGRRPLDDFVRGRFIACPLGDGSLNSRRLLGSLLSESGDRPVLLEPSCDERFRSAWLDASCEFINEVADSVRSR